MCVCVCAFKAVLGPYLSGPETKAPPLWCFALHRFQNVGCHSKQQQALESHDEVHLCPRCATKFADVAARGFERFAEEAPFGEAQPPFRRLASSVNDDFGEASADFLAALQHV